MFKLFNLLKASIFVLFFLILAGNNCIGQSTNSLLPKPEYILFYIPGVWQENKITYISEPVYYPGFEKCGDFQVFIDRAENEFKKYLSSVYGRVFYVDGYTEGLSNIQVIKNDQWEPPMTNMEEARNRIVEYIAKEKLNGYETVQITEFKIPTICH